MTEERKKCGRTACQNRLRKQYYRIENNPCSYPSYRDYCIPCGRRIVEYTPELEFKIEGKDERST